MTTLIKHLLINVNSSPIIHPVKIWSELICIHNFVTCVVFWPSTWPKNAIPRWCTGRKWHIPMASNRKRSRGRIKADNMGQGEGPTVPLQSDAPEESDLWTAWQLFLLDDDLTFNFKDRVGVERLYKASWVPEPVELQPVGDEMW